MKQTLAIFGDSFATTFKNNNTLGWTQLLENNYKVTNFASAGSSLFYSLDRFRKYQNNFDKVLFVVTIPGRLRVGINSGIDISEHRDITLETALYLVNELKEKNLSYRARIYQLVVDYYMYLQNTEYDQCVHNLMVDSIVSDRPDSILIPVANNSIENFKEKYTMINITEKENKIWNQLPGNDLDTRNSHMTKENNEIFYKNVLNWLSGEPVNINIDDYVQPTKEELKYYYNLKFNFRSEKTL